MNDINPKYDPAYEDMTPAADLCSERRCAEYRDEIECRLQRVEAKLRDSILQNGELKGELKIAHRDTDDARTMTNRLEGNLNGRLKELEAAHRLNERLQNALKHIATMDNRVEPMTWIGAFAEAVRVAKEALTEKPLSSHQIKLQHANDCPCESCEAHRLWYCPTCDTMMSSPESTRCVSGHERTILKRKEGS